ncbi:MAG: nitrate/nitrite transporter NrtS [Woeseiaceae bacterium]
MKDWLKVAMRNDVVVRSLKVGAIVGTLLTAINQGDLILSGDLTVAAIWKIPLTYLVPFSVSTYASVSSILAQREDAGNMHL